METGFHSPANPKCLNWILLSTNNCYVASMCFFFNPESHCPSAVAALLMWKWIKQLTVKIQIQKQQLKTHIQHGLLVSSFYSLDQQSPLSQCCISFHVGQQRNCMFFGIGNYFLFSNLSVSASSLKLLQLLLTHSSHKLPTVMEL